MDPLARWLDNRAPPPPDRLRSRFEPVHGGGASLSEALGRLAVGHLAEALKLPGRNRAAAFYLLAADALLTYACEAAVEQEDPEAALSRVLEWATGTRPPRTPPERLT